MFLCIVQVDYIIIGQGISGTFLSYYLLKAGKKVVVIDEFRPDTPSRVASGIINPVTGRRIVRTWLIEQLLPFAEQAYEDIGAVLDTEVARSVEMLSFHATEQMSSAWRDAIDGGEDYLQTITDTTAYHDVFNFHHGVGVTDPCLLVHLNKLLPAWRSYLEQKQILRNERFELDELTILEHSVSYKDIEAEKVIFCNGVEGYDIPQFKRLPFALSKGEAITVSIPALPQTHIYKQGMSLVPIGDDQFWVGSSFEWEFETDQPTDMFRQRVEKLLNEWVKLPYTIVDHKAAVRPASLERRPFVGVHPLHPSLAILNGMGTKGCSLAPFFANQLTQHLIHGAEIEPAADIKRFNKILSK